MLRNITFEMAMREHMVVLGGAGAGKRCLGMCMVRALCVCLLCVCMREKERLGESACVCADEPHALVVQVQQTERIVKVATHNSTVTATHSSTVTATHNSSVTVGSATQSSAACATCNAQYCFHTQTHNNTFTHCNATHNSVFDCHVVFDC